MKFIYLQDTIQFSLIKYFLLQSFNDLEKSKKYNEITEHYFVKIIFVKTSLSSNMVHYRPIELQVEHFSKSLKQDLKYNFV